MQNSWRRRRFGSPLPRAVISADGWGNLQLVTMIGTLCLLCLLFGGALALGANGAIPSARADGGAPNLAYIVGGGKQGDQLVVMDIGQRNVSWSVTLGGQPQGIVLSADARFAYIPETGANRIAIVDTHAHQVVGTMAVGSGPESIAVDPSGGLHWLFVANTNSDSLTVLDADTQQTRATLTVGHEPVAVAVATTMSGIGASGNASPLEIYVANRASQTLSVIAASTTGNPGDLRLVATIALPEAPCALTIPTTGATGGVAYVATCSGKVLAVGLTAHRVLGTLFANLGGAPGAMDYDAVTGQLYIPVPAKDQVVILRPAGVGADGNLVAPQEPLRVLPFAGAPSAVAITFDGALGFVTERGSGRVVEMDVSTHQTLATVTVGGAPRSVVTGPYPPALNQQSANAIIAAVYGAFALAIVSFLVIMVRKTIRGNIERSKNLERSKGASR